MKLHISHLTFKGLGIGSQTDNKSIIRWKIPKVLPNETVEATPIETKRGKYALLQNIYNTSEFRIQPACPLDTLCPACQFQACNPDEQLNLKTQQWLKLIRKFCTIHEKTIIESHKPRLLYHYRNRTNLLLKNGKLGLQTILGAEIPFLSLDNCKIHSIQLNQIIQNTQNILQNIPLNNIQFSIEECLENARITLITPNTDIELALQAAQLLKTLPNTSILLQELPPRGSHVYPPIRILTGNPLFQYTENISKQPLFALKGAWTPVSRQNANLIRDILADEINALNTNFNTCLEIGCGCGTHTDIFSKNAKQYVGIDSSWNAIQSAQHNATLNSWKNTEFRTDTDEHFLKKFHLRGNHADLIALHSCRLPFSENIAEQCKKLRAQQIFIVAPTAYALAQEIKLLQNKNYQLKKIHLCETMPHTYHMMGIALLAL